jgi:Spy/CpxP family protein refolding chaperone
MKSKINYLLSFATLTFMGLSFNAVASEKPIISPTNITTEIAQNATPRRQRIDGKGDKLMERLNLTSQQQQQMQSIRTKYQPEMDNIQEQMRVEREKMSMMMRNNESQNNLRSQHQKISALQQKMNNLRFESMLETREVLTPEQRQQFSAMMGQKRGNGRGQQK